MPDAQSSPTQLGPRGRGSKPLSHLSSKMQDILKWLAKEHKKLPEEEYIRWHPKRIFDKAKVSSISRTLRRLERKDLVVINHATRRTLFVKLNHSNKDLALVMTSAPLKEIRKKSRALESNVSPKQHAVLLALDELTRQSLRERSATEEKRRVYEELSVEVLFARCQPMNYRLFRNVLTALQSKGMASLTRRQDDEKEPITHVRINYTKSVMLTLDSYRMANISESAFKRTHLKRGYLMRAAQFRTTAEQLEFCLEDWRKGIALEHLPRDFIPIPPEAFTPIYIETYLEKTIPCLMAWADYFQAEAERPYTRTLPERNWNDLLDHPCSQTVPEQMLTDLRPKLAFSTQKNPLPDE